MQNQRAPMKTFRRKYLRIDYYPTQDAVAAIERLRNAKPGVCTRELLDTLVVQGCKSWFPEMVGTGKG
ncbi:MAG: hypothetical protein PHH58_10205 [Rhodoferax sp.]|nr:hypothetical protein [Rhodoferax sp.]